MFANTDLHADRTRAPERTVILMVDPKTGVMSGLATILLEHIALAS
jgi:hypothetical protein